MGNWVRLGHWWRTAVVISFAAAILRSGVFSEAGTNPLWYLAQFGPLVGSGIALLCQRSQPMRRVDWAVLITLAAIPVAALLSVVASAQPWTSGSQTGLLFVMLGFLALTYSRRWRTRTVLRGDLVLVFVLLNCTHLVGLAGALVGAPSAIDDFGRFQGLFSNANYAGMLACVAIPLAVYVYRFGNKPLALGGGLIASITLVLSGSRGALVAASAGLLLLLFLIPSRKRLVFTVTAAVAAIAAVGAVLVGPLIMSSLGRSFAREEQNSDVTSGRLEVYGVILNEWANSPVVGYGYRTTEAFTGGFAAHNTYLSALAETGIVGALALLSFIVAVLLAGRSSLILGPVVAIAVMELTESSVFGWGGPTALCAWLIVLAYARMPGLPPVIHTNERMPRTRDSRIAPVDE